MSNWVSYKEHHMPRVYRTRIADRGFRAMWNRYQECGQVTIGAGVVIGSYAYYLKWANARLRRV